MDGFMVKHYANDLFDYSETEASEAITENCVNLFLTVRGHALAKLVKKDSYESHFNMKIRAKHCTIFAIHRRTITNNC